MLTTWLSRITTKQRHQLQWCGFCLGALIISLTTLTPLDYLPPTPGSDKLHHVLGFAGWALLITIGSTRRFWVLCMVIWLWGGAIELIQPSVNRYGEWADFFANSLGVLLVIGVRWGYCQIIQRVQRS